MTNQMTARQNHIAAANEYEAARALFFAIGGNTQENRDRYNAAYEALGELNKIYGYPYAEYSAD